MSEKFPLGDTVVTSGVQERIPAIESIAPLLRRHQSGDWGDLGTLDSLANDDALINDERLLSSYTIEETKIWIITEADRSMTTVLLPEEY